MRTHLMFLALLGSATLAAHAGSDATTDIGTPPTAGSSSSATGLLTGNTFIGDTTYDKIWSLFTLYKDDSNPILQEFSLQGRLQVQYADGNSEDGHFDIEDFKNGSPANAQSVWGDISKPAAPVWALNPSGSKTGNSRARSTSIPPTGSTSSIGISTTCI